MEEGRGGCVRGGEGAGRYRVQLATIAVCVIILNQHLIPPPQPRRRPCWRRCHNKPVCAGGHRDECRSFHSSYPALAGYPSHAHPALATPYLYPPQDRHTRGCLLCDLLIGQRRPLWGIMALFAADQEWSRTKTSLSSDQEDTGALIETLLLQVH